MNSAHSSDPDFIINIMDEKKQNYPRLHPIARISSETGLLLPEEDLLGHPDQQLVHVVFEDTRGLHVLCIVALGLLFTI